MVFNDVIKNPNQKILNNPNILLNQINNYKINNEIIDWPFESQNAAIVVRSAFMFSDIFSMLENISFCGDLSLHLDVDITRDNPLFLENTDVTNFPFYNSSLTAKKYFEKEINPLFNNYSNFVRSAFFYLLSDVIVQNKRFPLLEFTMQCCSLLLPSTPITNLLIEDLRNNNIIKIFTLEFLESFNCYFDDKKIISICENRPFFSFEEASLFSPFLTIFNFYFSKEFVFAAIDDCYKNKNVVPMVLALRIYEIKLATQRQPSSKKEYFQNFQNFKKFLLINRLISKDFLTILLKKNNYSDPNSPAQFQTIGLFFCCTFATISLQNSFGQDGGPQPVSLTAIQQRATARTQSKLVNDAKYSTTITQSKKPSFLNRISRGKLGSSYAEATNTNILPEENPVLTDHQFNYNGISYTYQTFELNDQNYWSPYGISGRFGDMDLLLRALTTHVETNFPDHILFGGKAVPDHLQTIQARTGFHITRDDAMAVIVPADLNFFITNNQDLTDEFTNNDYRISSDSPDSQKNLKSLFYSRKRQSLIRTLLIISKNGPKVKGQKKLYDFTKYHIISSQIELGYQKAVDLEYKNIIKNFCRIYNLNPISIDSYLAFNDSMLLQARQKDFAKAEEYFNQYTTVISKLLISPNHLINQIIEGANIQRQAGVDFQHFIQNKSYCQSSQKKHKQLNAKIISLLTNILKNSENVTGFNKFKAKEAIDTFKAELKQESKQSRFLSVKELQRFINEKPSEKKKFQLGNFYLSKKNGRVLDITAQTAMELQAADGVERMILVENSNLIPTISLEFQTDVLLETDPYIQKLQKQLLDTIINYNELEDVIKNLDPNNDPFEDSSSILNDPVEDSSSILSDSLNSDDKNQETSIDDLPSVPKRKTSDEERLARLGSSQTPQSAKLPMKKD